MLATVIVVAPILCILIVAIGALSFSAPRLENRDEEARERPAVTPPQPSALVFAAPPPPAPEQLPVDQVLLAIDDHLRRERRAAAEFARDPSVSGLSLN